MSKREAKKQADTPSDEFTPEDRVRPGPEILFDPGQIIPIRAGEGKTLGVSFAHLQTNRQAAPAMSLTLADHLPSPLEQFRQGYAAYGTQPFVVGTIENGAVFQPSEWLPLACAVQSGGAVLLVKDDSKAVAFKFFVVLGFPGDEPCRESVAGFFSLAAEAGAHLTYEERVALGIVQETCAEAAWLAFVMTRLLGSRFIVERKDATLLINPFAACVKVLEDVARARQDAKVAEGGQAERARQAVVAQGGAEKDLAARPASDTRQPGEATPEPVSGTAAAVLEMPHAVRLRRIAAAFREFERLAEEARDAKAEPDSSEREEVIERQIEAAAVAALDLAAQNLRLLNSCRLSYGCAPETRDLLFAIEGFASLTTTERMQDAGEFVRRFESYGFRQLHPNTEWAHELERWASEFDRAAHAASDTRQVAVAGFALPSPTPLRLPDERQGNMSADPATDARELREIAEGFRWLETDAPEAGSPEVYERAKGILEQAAGSLLLINRAKDAYGCSPSVELVMALLSQYAGQRYALDERRYGSLRSACLQFKHMWQGDPHARSFSGQLEVWAAGLDGVASVQRSASTHKIYGKEYKPKPGENWLTPPVPMTELGRRLGGKKRMDPRAAKKHLLKHTHLWHQSRQGWSVLLNDLGDDLKRKVRCTPKRASSED